MSHLRVRAALRKKRAQGDDPSGPLPLIRLISHHHHVYGVVEAKAPKNTEERCRVYLGEEGQRADDLAYQGFPITPGIDYNIITAAAALPVLLALLPGAETLRFSAPAPKALPGGYPVIIREDTVELDLPKNVDLQEAVDFHWRISRFDGIESVADDGTVLFSDKAKQAVEDIDPSLCEPLGLHECLSRYQLLMSHINA
jgi:hypothetical protein